MTGASNYEQPEEQDGHERTGEDRCRCCVLEAEHELAASATKK
jgi:hypothetical protein